MPDHATLARLRALLVDLNASAAGCWDVSDGRLVLRAFVLGDDLPMKVSIDFTWATASVPLSESDLGIVRAALDGRVAVSVAADLPPDRGSGLWLRRFGAERSVAVPVFDADGETVRVVSVALPAGGADDLAVASAARRLDAGALPPDNGREDASDSPGAS